MHGLFPYKPKGLGRTTIFPFIGIVAVYGAASLPIAYAVCQNNYYERNGIVKKDLEYKKKHCEYTKQNPDAVDGDCERFYRGQGFNPKSWDGFKWGHVFK